MGWGMPKLERFLSAIAQVVRDRVAIMVMRFEIARLKVKNYDRLVETVQGLRRALETQKRALDDLHQQLDDKEAQIKILQNEYTALQQSQSQSEGASQAADRLDVFKRLQSIAVQLPTLRAAIAEGGDLTARDVLDLLAPFDEMLRDFGFERIGEAGAQVPFDSTRHRPVGRGARSISSTDVVRVRYVGYLYRGEVVCKAEVAPIAQSELVA
jgi:TolA-binding protein